VRLIELKTGGLHVDRTWEKVNSVIIASYHLFGKHGEIESGTGKNIYDPFGSFERFAMCYDYPRCIDFLPNRPGHPCTIFATAKTFLYPTTALYHYFLTLSNLRGWPRPVLPLHEPYD
jgi:hypothetical protein